MTVADSEHPSRSTLRAWAPVVCCEKGTALAAKLTESFCPPDPALHCVVPWNSLRGITCAARAVPACVSRTQQQSNAQHSALLSGGLSLGLLSVCPHPNKCC